MNEITFTKHLLVAFSRSLPVRVWRQNCGKVPIRDGNGDVQRYFDAGPPKGAADISGVVRPEGWRLEVEVKMPAGERSPEQLAWAAKCAEWGAVYALVRYSDALTLEQNLAEAARVVAAAIEARRKG